MNLSLLSALDHSQPDLSCSILTSSISWSMPIFLVAALGTSVVCSFHGLLLSAATKFGSEGHKTLPGAGYNVSACLSVIAMINLVGLLSFTYTPTSSVWLTSALALTTWTAIVASSISFSSKSFFGGLVPSGVPLAMGSVLSAIEFLSVVIRPVTLLVRLAANISTGHILMALMATSLSALIVPLMIGFNIFEAGVGLLQAYIFALLLKIYLSEHPF